MQFNLYYNPHTDEIALAADGWDYLVSCRFVAYCTPVRQSWPDAGDPREIKYVEHEIAIPFSDEWEFLGEMF